MEKIILTQLFLELQQAASDAVLQQKVATKRNVTLELLEPSEEAGVSRYVVTYHRDLPDQVNPWFSTTSLLEAAARAHLIVTGGLY
jgi:hypothetical protein